MSRTIAPWVSTRRAHSLLKAWSDDTLAFEIDRLHRSCRRLIWLNPLLRFEGFEPRARGIKTMLGHVDEFRPVHNLESMAALVAAFRGRDGRAGEPKAWMEKVA